MRRLVIIYLLTLGNLLQAQLTVIVESIPANTPTDANIHIAGNFNNWNPGSAQHILARAESIYTIDLNIAPTNMLFKFTRGSWATVEGTEQGGFRPDRSYNYTGGIDTLRLSIAGWEDLGGGGMSTASPNVEILTDSFYMTALNRYRRIWIYTPPDYDKSEEEYTVLYMHDGQNLFDNLTSFAGEWQVDEALDNLSNTGFPVGIVVGIGNGGGQRINEYTPWTHPQHGGGQAALYMDFLTNELKPYIDANYRTKTDRMDTGIMGSSLGGLVSLYGGMIHNDTYGKIGSFSGSYWFDQRIYSLAANEGIHTETYIYMIAGGQEGGNQVGDMYRIQDSLLSNHLSNDHIIAIDHPNGRHNEAYWRSEFAEAYKWLFQERSSNTDEISPKSEDEYFGMGIYSTVLNLKSTIPDTVHYRIYDINGALLMSGQFFEFAEVQVAQFSGKQIVVNVFDKKGKRQKSRVFFVI
jgi:predicted alpha/beta superfamily hydrolase